MNEKDPGLSYQIPGVDTGESLAFQDGREVVEVDKEHAEIVWAALAKADGYNTKRQIVDGLIEDGHDSKSSEDVIDDLIALHILGASTEQYKRFHKFTKNPSIYGTALSSEDIQEITQRPYPEPKPGVIFELPTKPGLIAELSVKRYSNRAFDKEPLELADIGELLANTMSMERTPIPSAGGLYGLRIYAFIKPGHEIPAGRYQYNPTSSDLVLINGDYDDAELSYALNQEDALHDAPAIFIISADLSRHSEKYGDRGYRYVNIEAGHAAQSIHLTAGELGLTTLEYGGFNDEEISTMLDLDKDEEPLIAVAVGKPALESKKPSYLTLAELDSYYVGEEKPVDYVAVDPPNNKVNLQFYSATARYKPPNQAYSQGTNERYAAGTARSMNVAMIKAIAEAYERYASGNYKIDREGAASELGAAWLDPRLVRPLTDEQLENNPHMQPFDESSKIDWVEGKKAGERILVPIDMAYYPLNPHILDRALVAEADSSGVAAHTNEGTATRLALFELIERDAMMRNWLSQQSPDRLDGNLLPSHVQKRLEYWKECGYDMHVLDMSGDTAVIQTVLVNQKMEYPYFVNGAAASLEYDHAINKSLEEAELGLAHALSNATHERIEATDVRNPAHHGQFYYSPENAKYISWLWQGKVKDSLRNIDKDLDIIDRYTPIVVKLNSSEEPLSVVRVIAPSLVPINFGTGTEYFSHQSSGVTQKPDHVGKAPHYFA